MMVTDLFKDWTVRYNFLRSFIERHYAINTINLLTLIGQILNPVNIAPGDDDHVTAAELTSPSSSSSFLDGENDWNGEPDHKFFLGYDFNAVNSWEFHDKDHYPIFGGILVELVELNKNSLVN